MNKYQIVKVVSISMLCFLLFPIPGTASNYSHYQACKIPSVLSEQSNNANQNDQRTEDKAVIKFQETEWKTDILDIKEVRQDNRSTESLRHRRNAIAPKLPTKSIENESMQIETTRDFSNHVWSWEFGPDDRHIEAPAVTRCLEGNWFPKSQYSRITYIVTVSENTKIDFRIDRGADTYSRFLRVYDGSTRLINQVVVGNSYTGSITISGGTYHYITLEIYYGGYVSKGWELRYWQTFTEDSEGYWQPVDISMQLFQEGTSDIELYDVPMGPETKLNIETMNVHDLYTRYLYVYVDGYFKTKLYAPGSYEINLGDFSSPGLHSLKLVLAPATSTFGDYPKGIEQLYVTYDYRHVEVDSMSGHSQPQWVYDYVESYYATHDYRRVKFHPDDNNIPHEDLITDDDLENLQDNYASETTKTNELWTWGFFCHRLYSNYYACWVWGLGSGYHRRFAISDFISDDNGRDWVLMHEFGHTEHMYDGSGYKTDCFPVDEYGTTYTDWITPHYSSESWVNHLTWVGTTW